MLVVNNRTFLFYDFIYDYFAYIYKISLTILNYADARLRTN